jgi:hypothetical protein
LKTQKQLNDIQSAGKKKKNKQHNSNKSISAKLNYTNEREINFFFKKVKKKKK